MKVGMLSPSISRNNGGVTEVKRRLSQTLTKEFGLDIKVFGLDDENTKTDYDLWAPLMPETYPKSGPSALAFSQALLTNLKMANLDIVHLHGLWQYPSYVALKSGKPYITTVHGMLEKWAIQNSAFKKAIASILYEKSALQKASCLQAFTVQEYNDIRSYGLKNAVCIVPNGVDIPGNINELRQENAVWEGIVGTKKVLLYLGRIHQKKGLTNLIKSWKRICVENSSASNDWSLVIAGWDQGNYESELKMLVKELGVTNNVFFLGPQFKRDKELVFAHAQAFILPSFSEGLPMAVLEAWSYELPVLMTSACNLPDGFAAGASLEIEPAEEGIVSGLRALFEMSENEMEHMGFKGRRLVAEKYNWKTVADHLYQVYSWILGGGAHPSYVITT